MRKGLRSISLAADFHPLLDAQSILGLARCMRARPSEVHAVVSRGMRKTHYAKRIKSKFIRCPREYLTYLVCSRRDEMRRHASNRKYLIPSVKIDSLVGSIVQYYEVMQLQNLLLVFFVTNTNKFCNNSCHRLPADETK